MDIRSGDRVVFSRLDNEDEEYFTEYLGEEGIVLCVLEGRFPCVYVKFDNYEDEEYLYVKNLDRI